MYLNRTESRALAKELQRAVGSEAHLELAVFPTALAFSDVAAVLQETPIKLGAQNAYWIPKGGYTGEVSAEMFKEAGATYALIGHSERRHLAHETNHVVRQKIEATLEAGLIPVLCVGETLAEHDAGRAIEVVEIQLRSALEHLTCPAGRPIIIAYEPVWAIGSGQACEPGVVGEMHAKIAEFVRALLPAVTAPILYGGSVKAENVRSYLVQPGVAGVLVGASGVTAPTWQAIADALMGAV